MYGFYADCSGFLCVLHGVNGTVHAATKVSFPRVEISVFDIAYIVGILLFFALMLAYVRACAALGRRNPGDVAADERAA